jgi:tripartite-type tricarboxylate transporter receptor subunit TctC
MGLLHSLLPALLLVVPSALAQTGYPDRPIRMIVPLAAASAVDVAARIVTQKMADNMGQQIVIINQPGASGLIGAEQVARAEPDGYTIGGFNDSIMTMVPNLHANMRWDIRRDFEPVSLVATVEWGLITGDQTGYRTAADLIAAARAAPGKINYGSGGPGSPQHLAMAMFAAAAGISLTHVPYKGATQAATDVAAGQIPVGFQGLGTVAGLVRSGQLRLIGVPTEQRLPQFPDVPTVSESGLPGFFFNSWFAILAPAGTPKDNHRKAERRGSQGARRPRDSSPARATGFRRARQFARTIACQDARSACQICPRDQGNGDRQRIGRGCRVSHTPKLFSDYSHPSRASR